MGIVFTPIGSVDVIVVIANMGYVFMALCCFAAWIQLEKSQLDMPRPYKCPKWLVISEPDSIVHATPENAAIIQSHFEARISSSASAEARSAICANMPPITLTTKILCLWSSFRLRCPSTHFRTTPPSCS